MAVGDVAFDGGPKGWLLEVRDVAYVPRQGEGRTPGPPEGGDVAGGDVAGSDVAGDGDVAGLVGVGVGDEHAPA